MSKLTNTAEFLTIEEAEIAWEHANGNDIVLTKMEDDDLVFLQFKSSSDTLSASYDSDDLKMLVKEMEKILDGETSVFNFFRGDGSMEVNVESTKKGTYVLTGSLDAGDEEEIVISYELDRFDLRDLTKTMQNVEMCYC